MILLNVQRGGKDNMANMYKKRRDEGVCVKCGKELDRQGVYCSKCLVKISKEHKDMRQWYQSNGICPVCKKEKLFGDEKECPVCAAKKYEITMRSRKKHGTEHYNSNHAEWQKKKYHERIKLGICARCGKRKADYGYKTCGICRMKGRKSKLRSSKKEEWRENGLCVFCGEPVKENFKVCEKHYNMCIEKLNNQKTILAREQFKERMKKAYEFRKTIILND